MKRKISVILAFFLMSIISFSASYNISNLTVVANLKKNTSMEVQEYVTYNIEEINGLYFDIDARGTSGLADLNIYEDICLNESGEYSYKKIDSSKYEISLNDELYRVKLYSKNKNKTRTFVLVYTLTDAVQVYDDIAQFNRKVVGQNWQQSIDNVDVNIVLPVNKNCKNLKIYAYGHGPLSGEVNIEENTIKYKLQNYYPGDFIEAHILTEPKVFSEVNKNRIIHKNMKNELLKMEERLAKEANKVRENALKKEQFYENIRKYDKHIFGLELGIWSFLMFYIHKIFKKKNKYKEFYGKYLRELPDNYSPSLVGEIMTGSANSEEILATLLDLVRRKIINLDDSLDNNKLILSGNTETLSAQEQIIIDIYFNDFGNGREVILEDVGKEGIPMKIARKFEKWQSLISLEMYQKKFVHEGLGISKCFLFFIIGLGMFVSVIFHMVIFDNPIFILLAFMGFLLIASTLGARRPADELQKAKSRWGAFKNFLEDYSLLEEAKISSIHLWEHYFVYAVAMGISEQVVKSYKKALEMGYVNDVPSSIGAMRTGSILNMYSNSRGSFYNSLNSVTKNSYRHSMNEIARSRRSSSFGGGFSSGSSGGGGSRGGGGAF